MNGMDKEEIKSGGAGQESVIWSSQAVTVAVRSVHTKPTKKFAVISM